MHRASNQQYQSIRAVMKRHEADLRTLPGVEDVGIAGDEESGYAVSLRVRNLPDAVRRQLPQTLDGYPVMLEDLGATIICPKVADD